VLERFLVETNFFESGEEMIEEIAAECCEHLGKHLSGMMGR
jgi:hypothetical protein